MSKSYELKLNRIYRPDNFGRKVTVILWLKTPKCLLFSGNKICPGDEEGSGPPDSLHGGGEAGQNTAHGGGFKRGG